MPRKKTDTPKTADGMPYEEAFGQLEGIARTLEEGGLPLEDSLALYARGMELSRYLDNMLKAGEQRITQLMENGGEAPFAAIVQTDSAGERP